MPIKIILCLLVFTAEASASKNIFTSVGEKVELRGKGPFHFSAKEDVKVFLKSHPSFFITSKVGLFEFYQNKEKYSLFSMNPTQFKFQTKIEPLIKHLSHSSWSMVDENLILTSTGLDFEIRDFLIKICDSISDGTVLLDFKAESDNLHITTLCQRSLQPKSERTVKMIVIESSRIKNSNYGLGVPSSVNWQLDSSGQVTLPDLMGETKFNRGRLESNGDLFFVSNISKENPVTFETGSEVGIQQSGIFNRQATEWKKATTNISLEMLENEKDQTKIKITLDKRSRTGQGLVFEIEKLNKSAFLKNNIWKKVLTFKDTNKSKGRDGIFGLGISGSSNRSRSESQKEIWLQVSDQKPNNNQINGTR
jgi:hypothetical protein